MTKTTETPDFTAAVDFYRGNSEIASNGVRKIPKAIFLMRLSEQGVDEKTAKNVQDVIDFETSVAARVALSDAEDLIAKASKEDLANDDFRRGLSATVRLPTFGGSTDVTVHAESVANIPARPDGEGTTERGTKTTHGRTQTKITAKGRIDKPFHEEAAARMRAALGISE